jgi:hypothetical protein
MKKRADVLNADLDIVYDKRTIEIFMQLHTQA